MDQITRSEPRLPRQIDDTIPKELQRICLKGLAKQVSERLSTPLDMVEDLQHFLQTESTTASPGVTSSDSPARLPHGSADRSPPSPPRPDSDLPAVKIVPNDLRSFDQHDADFFVVLLPGARDPEGLAESIRFWKKKIEPVDPDMTFKVGLIHGPSGCGKSSLVNAGLLRRVADPEAE